MRYGDGDAPSNIFLQDSATGASGAVGVEHATCSGKKHFCRMRLFCTLEKHACLKQNEKENVEMDLPKMPTSKIPLIESFKESM